MVGVSLAYSDCMINQKPEYLNQALNSEESKIMKLIQKREDLTDNIVMIKTNNIMQEAQKCIQQEEKNHKVIFDIVDSGAKGSIMNITQIMLLVGQQIVGRGTPPPLSNESKRRMPHFHDCASIESMGFCKNSYMNGLNPSEFYMHYQTARVALTNIGANTPRTGYASRRLEKTLGDVISDNYGTITNNGREIVQFCYGNNNLDMTKSPNVKDFIDVDSIVRDIERIGN